MLGEACDVLCHRDLLPPEPLLHLADLGLLDPKGDRRFVSAQPRVPPTMILAAVPADRGGWKVKAAGATTCTRPELDNIADHIPARQRPSYVITVLLALIATAFAETIEQAFPVPPGSDRVATDAWGDWLRALPLYERDRAVLSYDGRVMAIGAARVVNVPIGTRDLQQCADSALRLRATWELSVGRSPAFHYTSGDVSSWAAWAAGTRPRVSGNKVRFVADAAAPDSSSGAFEAWLMDLYTYAGTRSLPMDTSPVGTPLPGDIIVAPGSPGHAVVLLDVASDTTYTWVLVGQGFMPAMDFHVLPGPVSGWFLVEGDRLPSSPIPMPWTGLRRWK